MLSHFFSELPWDHRAIWRYRMATISQEMFTTVDCVLGQFRSPHICAIDMLCRDE
jgi:predicted nuclease of restriction endonuclease-like (RecB) superfamily